MSLKQVSRWPRNLMLSREEKVSQKTRGEKLPERVKGARQRDWFETTQEAGRV